MTKFYSLFAAVVLAASVNAQQQTVFTANFDDVAGSGGNDGGWNGNVATVGATAPAEWTYVNMYEGDKCLKGGASSKAGSITTPELTQLAGVATLTFRAGAWIGNGEKLELKVTLTGGGTLDKTSVTLVPGTFTTYTIEITGGTATSKLEFASGVTSKSRFFIDDILVTAPTQAVVDVNTAKTNIVKNTVVENNIMFAAKADVQILNMNGQVVKTASVNENTSLDVATLAKGMYVVTATVNGKAVSQKIIKK